MKSFKEYLNEAKSYYPEEVERILSKEAANFFGSNFNYVDDAYGIGDVEVALKSSDKPGLKKFAAHLKSKVFGPKFQYEIMDDTGMWVRHPRVADKF